MVKSPSREPRKLGREGEKDERLAKFITREMGMQIAFGMGTYVPSQSIVWQSSEEGWGGYTETVSSA